MSEKCPNCGAKLGGFFGKTIMEDDQIKDLNKTIKDVKDKMVRDGLGDSAKDLEELGEGYCSGCYSKSLKQVEKSLKIWEKNT